MLRIILLLLVLYIVFQIAVRLLLTESPSQKRSRIYGQDGYRSGNHDRHGGNHQSRRGRFDHIEDAEFEEIPDDSSEEK